MSEAGAVIVTYFPDAGFDARLAAIAREFQPLIVVDNSTDPEITRRLWSLCQTHHAELVLNPANLGLGAALNHAFDLLAQRGLTWAAAFDQDSTPATGFRAELLTVAEAKASCAVIGANWTDEARPDFASRHLRATTWPFIFERIPATETLSRVTCVITSGSLFRLTTWRKLGGFDAGLFLDLVDTEFCLRARRAGFDICVAAGARLRHRRAEKRPVTFLGRTWWPAFVSPPRLRLLFRNRVLLCRRHGWRMPHWVSFEIVYTAKICAEVLLLENRKGAKLAACLQGTWDGLLGRTGPLTKAWKKASARPLAS